MLGDQVADAGLQFPDRAVPANLRRDPPAASQEGLAPVYPSAPRPPHSSRPAPRTLRRRCPRAAFRTTDRRSPRHSLASTSGASGGSAGISSFTNSPARDTGTSGPPWAALILPCALLRNKSTASAPTKAPRSRPGNPQGPPGRLPRRSLGTCQKIVHRARSHLEKTAVGLQFAVQVAGEHHDVLFPQRQGFEGRAGKPYQIHSDGRHPFDRANEIRHLDALYRD